MSMFIDFPEVRDVIIEGMEGIRLPKMIMVAQEFDASEITDVPGHIRRKMDEALQAQTFRGKRICVTAGSRGIPHFDRILRTICDTLKAWGAAPFVIPAMGSHGGGTAEGQLELLESYGITERTMGVPVVSSMEVVQYGALNDGTPLYCDKHAYESDGIVVLNMQKPHTDFHGPHESGLAKMIAIGLGKHKGASAFHMQGFPTFRERVPEAAERFLRSAPVAFGVGIVQNAYGGLCKIEIARPEALMEMDRQNLIEAKKRLATFKCKDIDVLVIDWIGKNINGYGHDPNVTGRANGSDESFKHILNLKKMVILGVTEESHHNGTGIAEADVTTLRCVRDIDWAVVWTNLITSTEIQGCSIPMYANSDREAILLAIRACNGVDFNAIRLARIKDTQHMTQIEVSEALYEEMKHLEGVRYIKGPYEMAFDQQGNLLRGYNM